MSEEALKHFRYQPRRCRFLQAEVWAIECQQPDGAWQVVNCLDKDTSCFQHACVFTASEGSWPFDPPAASAGAAGG